MLHRILMMATTRNSKPGTLFLILLIIPLASADNWGMEIHFHQYSNPGGLLSNEQCCDNLEDCVCEPEFRICLRLTTGITCPYSDFRIDTASTVSSNLIQFGDMINTLSNPLIFTAGGSLTEVPDSGLVIFIRVRDDPSNNYIDRIYIPVPHIGTVVDSALFTGNLDVVSLVISCELYCQQNYYTSNCSVYCVPTDDVTGHYTCVLSAGDKICLPEYQNADTDCAEVACALVCTGEGGSCSESGVCECSQGWSGTDCGTAKRAENCHPEGGYCDQPGQCLCNTHWKGTNCGQFLCHPNCSPAGGTCENAGGCDCLPDYTGEYCETDLNPCAHLIPCQNGGTCSNGDPNQYDSACPPGYTGLDCEEDIDECNMHVSVCQQCHLHSSYQCLCVLGWTGEHCENNTDDCSPQPCQNGGNCSDLVNDYYCTRPGEYEGHNCSIIVNNCIPNPCQHNGTCFDMITGHQCICSEGYSGSACELTIPSTMSKPTLPIPPSQTIPTTAKQLLPVEALVGGAIGTVLLMIALLALLIGMSILVIRKARGDKQTTSENGTSINRYIDDNIYATPSSDGLERDFDNQLYDTATGEKPENIVDISNPLYSSCIYGGNEQVPEYECVANAKSTQETNKLHDYCTDSELYSTPIDGMAAVQAEVGQDDGIYSKVNSSTVYA